MSYGLTIKNNAGQVFISPNVTPMNFIKKINVTIPRGNIKIRKININTGISDAHIVLPFVRAVGLIEDAPAMVSSVRSINGFKFIEIAYSNNFEFNLEVYLFANYVPRLTSYGLEIYNEKHNLVYNNSCKPLEMDFCRVPDHNLFNKSKQTLERNSLKIELGFPVAVLCTVYGSKLFNLPTFGNLIFDIFSTAINESVCLHLLVNIKGKHITNFPKIENIPFIDIRKYQ